MWWSRAVGFARRLAEVLDAVALQWMAQLGQTPQRVADAVRVCGRQRVAASRLWRQAQLVGQDEAVAVLASLPWSGLAVRLAWCLVGGLLVAACRLADEVRRWMGIGRVGRLIGRARAGAVSVAQAQ